MLDRHLKLTVSLTTIYLLGALVLYGNVELASRLATNSDQITYRNQDLEKYPQLKAVLSGTVGIPGLDNKFVPQGIAIVPDSGNILLSGYRVLREEKIFGIIKSKQEQAMVYLIDREEGKPVRSVELHTAKKEPLHSHAGGVAVLGQHFWVSCKSKLYRFKLGDLIESDLSQKGILCSDSAPIYVDSKASFLGIWKNYLLVGDFRSPSDKPYASHHVSPTSDHIAWTAAYQINKATGDPTSTTYYKLQSQNQPVLKPDFAIHHRRRVQGITTNESGLVALSISYGDNNSKIAFYNADLLSLPDQTKLPNGETIPSITLSKEDNWLQTLIAPPGSEGIAWTGDSFAIPFEGGAYPYRERWKTREDRILLIRPTQTE